MKKFLPFVFPALALVLVLYLGVRWYNSKTARSTDDTKVPEFAEGVKIEDLSASQAGKLRQPAKDEKSVKLTGTDSDTNAASASGEIRYDITDGKVNMSVFAEQPELKSGVYQVWFKQVDGNATKKAFILNFTKSGYTGSAAISADTLPFEVVVTKQSSADDKVMGSTILTGVINK